jgi:hypothetical protein
MHPSVANGPLVPPLGWVRREDGTWAPPGFEHRPDTGDPASDEPVTVSVVRVGRPHRRRGRVLALFVVALLALAGGAYAVAGKTNKEPTVDVRDETTIRRTTTTESTTTTEITTTEITTTTVPDTTTSIDWAAVGALAAAQASSSTTTAPPVRHRGVASTTSIDWAAIAAAQAGQAPPATPATFPPPTVPDTTTPLPVDPVTTAPSPSDPTP